MTNDKHYQPGFRALELDPAIAASLVLDEELYDLYTDGLILIHDLISPLSSEAADTRFMPAEIETQIANVRLDIRRHMDEADDFPLEASAVLDNLLGNYELARQFVGQAATSEDRFAVETSATQFTHSLTQIYTTLRTLSRYTAPTDFE